MTSLKEYLAASVPASFKDARLSLESVLANCALTLAQAQTSAYAVALSLGTGRGLAAALKEGLSDDQLEQAEVAAAIMGMTNVYYSFQDTVRIPGISALPAQLRMVAYGQQASKDKLGFEIASLAVSIAGKCKPCIVSHVEELQKLAATNEQLRDIARIAASVTAVSKVA